jgi:2-phosphosulfolactate phosphatase
MTAARTVDLAWGVAGVRALAPDCDVLVVVDVLSFTTAVSVAVACGASVRPLAPGERLPGVAPGDVLAGPRDGPGPTLSPMSLRDLRPGQRLLLPSPNGGAVAAALGEVIAVSAALRNTRAVVEWLRDFGGNRIGIVAAGEQGEDGRWRPAYEDALGAGAVAARLGARCSPQAEAAAVAFRSAESALAGELRACRSGDELVRAGFDADVAMAAELDVDAVVPQWRDRVFAAAS